LRQEVGYQQKSYEGEEDSHVGVNA
jgi:hypothetical protein